MRKASTRLPEQGTQTPSPAPDLIPAETKNLTENSHGDWYSKRGHFRELSLVKLSLWKHDSKPVRFPGQISLGKGIPLRSESGGN
jgi:hypothetical protein